MAPDRQHRLILLLLVAGSYALRAGTYIQLSGGPFLQLHRWQQTDMNYYDAWGRAVAQGDWLSETIGVPMHDWHYDVADHYFAAHPGVRPDPVQLWTHWNGPHRFYQDPLYPYLVALTYRVKADPRLVLAWQLALGILTNVLIYVLTRRYFGDGAGVIAAVLALLCGPLIYYELLLLRDSTIVFAELAVVWLADRALVRNRWPWFVALGGALGCAVLLKSSFILLAAALVGGLVVSLRGRSAWRSVVAVAAGLTLALLPAAVRNVALGVPPLAWAGSGALTFVVANGPSYPAIGGFDVRADEVAAIMSESDGRFLPAVARTLALHTPSTFALLIWHKTASALHWYEIPNNANFYYLRLHAFVLRWLPLTFFTIGPLGLVGLALAASRTRTLWPLYLIVAVAFVSLAGFVVIGRLRAPLMAALIPFAAFTLERFLRARPIAVAGLGGAVLAVGLWTGRPLPEGRTLIRQTDWMMPYLARYQFDVQAATDAGDAAAAAAAYRAFLRYEPDFSRMPASAGVLREPTDRDTARTFARIHEICGGLFRDTDHPEEVRAEQTRATLLQKMAGGR
jgi:hypothetical protein